MRHSLRTTLFPSPFYFSFGDRDREKRREERGRAPMAGGGVGWLVGWLVGRSVGRSVGPLVSDRGSSLVRPPPPFTLSRAKGSLGMAGGRLGILGDGGGRRAFRYCLSQVVVKPAVPRCYAAPTAFRKRTNENSDRRSFLLSLYFSLENTARQKSPHFVSRRSVATATRKSRQHSKKYQIYGRENIRVRDTRNGFSSRDLRGRREGSSLMDLRRNL